MINFLRYILDQVVLLPLFSKGWDDIIFEYRNKEYGAYELRRIIAKNQVIGLGITLVCFSGFILYVFSGYDEYTPMDFEFEEMIEYKGFDANLITVPPVKKEQAPPPPSKTKEPVAEKEKENLPPEVKKEVQEDKKQVSEARSDSATKSDKTGKDSAKTYEAGADSGSTKVKYAEGKAEYYGGQIEFQKWVAMNIRCPREVIESMMVQATVEVFFNIDEEGNIKDVRLLKGFNSECDNEVIRVIQSSPKWKPRVINGVAVVQRTKVGIIIDPNYYRHHQQYK